MMSRDANISEATARRIEALEGRFPYFLGVVLLPILVLPSMNLQGGLWERLVLPAVGSWLILQGLWTLPALNASARARRRWQVYRAFGVVAAVLVWIPSFAGSAGRGAFGGGLLVFVSLFYGMTAVRLLEVLGHSGRVTWRTLCLGAAGYIHLGLVGGQFATTLQMMDPKCFQLGAVANAEQLLERLTYFSFVTIGTLGFGDIVPGNARGEQFVILLSLSSTLYLTLLLGLLLGRFVSSQRGGEVRE